MATRRTILLSFFILIINTIVGQTFIPMEYPEYPFDKILGGITVPMLVGSDALFVKGRIGFLFAFPNSYKWVSERRETFHEIGYELGYMERNYTQNVSDFHNHFLLYQQQYGFVENVDLGKFKEGIDNYNISPTNDDFNIKSLYLSLYYKGYFYGKWYLKPSYLIGLSVSMPIIGQGQLIMQGQTPNGSTFNYVVRTDYLAHLFYDGIIGTGLDFSMGKCFRVFGLGIRYYYGFSHIIPKYQYQYHEFGSKKLDLKERSFSFDLTLYIGDWFNN